MAFDPDTLARARAYVADRCATVGLKPEERTREGVPKDASLWSSDYASVMLWPIADAAALPHEANRAEGVFHDVLSAREKPKSARPIDGYLILLLATAPPAELDDAVRHLELSPQICRKHVAWPIGDDAHDQEWRRIDSVTVLGLPESRSAGSVDVSWPELKGPELELWQELEGKNAANLAKRHGAQQ